MKLSLPEFSPLKRDEQLDFKHYSANYDFMQEALDIVAETLLLPEEELAGMPPADLMHPTHERALMMTNFISTCYGAGHDVAELRALYPSLIEFWETYAKYSKAYNESTSPPGEAAHIALADSGFDIANRLVCWAILLGHESLLGRMPALIDYNNPSRDAMLERLLALYTPGRGSHPDDCIRHLPYFKTLKIFAAPASERSALVAEYLDDWYAASRREPYYDSHKRDSSFNGYWCWEAAAITIALDIDDSSYCDAQFYPRDLADFARQAKHDYSPPGTPPIDANELRAKAGDPCPKAGLWQSLDVPAREQRFEHLQAMPNLESAYGLTVWRFVK